MVKYEKDKEAKYAETINEEEMGQRVEGQENYWDKEPDIAVHASAFVISQPYSLSPSHQPHIAPGFVRGCARHFR
ncbi:unnamed protein product [Gongylonema pulchrum]|uniref:Uncharacterized protein n=1 Tax=Gongylonema pulchrum TaxID=637853 RepID=A0A183EQW9_9BILA|nr:unnamed protein product [Gongylonema pulchrum]